MLWVFHLIKLYILAVFGLKMIVARSGLLRITSLRLLNAPLALLGSLLLCATDSAEEAEDGVEETPQGGYAHKEEEQKQIPEEIAIPQKGSYSISLPSWFQQANLQAKDFHHLERMLYSCLVDADYLDTEQFMQPNQTALRGSTTKVGELLPMLERHLSCFGTPTTEVNKIRDEIQQACLAESERLSGFYSLTVPTGGGKTLSSLVWALNHATHNGKKRIIIAIPYTRCSSCHEV